MKDVYGNKMMKGYENKEIKQVPKYIGGFSVWIPDLKKIINPGELVPEFNLEEAKNRADFIITTKGE